MNCDDCKYYEWYYDYCKKWECQVDAREVHNCYERRKTLIRDLMVNLTILAANPQEPGGWPMAYCFTQGSKDYFGTEDAKVTGGTMYKIEPEEMPKFLNDLAADYFAKNSEVSSKLAQCSVYIHGVIAAIKDRQLQKDQQVNTHKKR